jgi:hypothetical protein
MAPDDVTTEEIVALQIVLAQDAPPPKFDELRRTWPAFKKAFEENATEHTEE